MDQFEFGLYVHSLLLAKLGGTSDNRFQMLCIPQKEFPFETPQTSC